MTTKPEMNQLYNDEAGFVTSRGILRQELFRSLTPMERLGIYKSIPQKVRPLPKSVRTMKNRELADLRKALDYFEDHHVVYNINNGVLTGKIINRDEIKKPY